eukprot:176265-Prorocentrum_minimum.AAC.1
MLGPAVFQTAVRHRLRQPQPVALPIRVCGGCGAEIDVEATHYVHCRGGGGVGGGNYLARGGSSSRTTWDLRATRLATARTAWSLTRRGQGLTS